LYRAVVPRSALGSCVHRKVEKTVECMRFLITGKSVTGPKIEKNAACMNVDLCLWGASCISKHLWSGHDTHSQRQSAPIYAKAFTFANQPFSSCQLCGKRRADTCRGLTQVAQVCAGCFGLRCTSWAHLRQAPCSNHAYGLT